MGDEVGLGEGYDEVVGGEDGSVIVAMGFERFCYQRNLPYFLSPIFVALFMIKGQAHTNVITSDRGIITMPVRDATSHF